MRHLTFVANKKGTCYVSKATVSTLSGSYREYAVLCKTGLRRWFDLPRNVRKLKLKFTKKPLNDNSMKCKVYKSEGGLYSFYKVKLDDRRCRANLDMCLKEYVFDNFDGECYITLEYEEE